MSTAELTIRDKIVEVIGNFECGTIEQLERHCVQSGVFASDDFRRSVVTRAPRAEIRKAIKSMEDENGNKVFASVVTTDENGEPIRIYKQEMLFDVDDYRQCVGYRAERCRYEGKVTMGYVARCLERFGVQLEFDLTFDE